MKINTMFLFLILTAAIATLFVTYQLVIVRGAALGSVMITGSISLVVSILVIICTLRWVRGSDK